MVVSSFVVLDRSHYNSSSCSCNSVVWGMPVSLYIVPTLSNNKKIYISSYIRPSFMVVSLTPRFKSLPLFPSLFSSNFAYHT
jgi:hypothetical protein